MQFLRKLGVVAAGALASFSLFAADADVSTITERFSKLGLAVSSVTDSDIAGLYEVETNQGLFLSTQKGDYFIQGKIYALDDKGNFTDVIAKRYADKIGDFSSSWIEYKAKEEKHVVTVFTDIDCGYCLKLHRQMQEYNEKGITVRYMAYPRAGVQSQVGQQMSQIWCSVDQKAAMDEMKLQRSFSQKVREKEECLSTIAAHRDLGSKMGVRGTPAIVTSNGSVIGGYLSPDDLTAQLERLN
ncbi:bifunctional protein-disulfide isomerase/oxidoreductase DsbC [Vibrio penaeicida]|uniref:bifunctional protein-disulfide isomerase/oxidoreductase DsbC n=1 Tax=Vibrio penaeicida TaxID=104609 RepID=UPI000CEA3A4D|nr:bifunctional protein-disulfide isomerase/oxidoreductase DsbC [Vibrio penaeicida]